MPGERILLVDSSASVLDMSKNILEENGFQVVTASNGVAALSHPDLTSFQAIVVDTTLDGMDGLEVASQIRTEAQTHEIPVLLLVPKEQIRQTASQSLRGANGYIAKPFSPQDLLVKVEEVIEEQRLRVLSKRYLEESADRHMQSLAEQKIQQAVEKKIQIIVERAIQSIVSIIDQRAQKEVDARVTALTAEKEQELVRQTVQEVARSMVEKMAERKVTEAMEAILQENTEKTVRRATESILPNMVRERVRESLDNTLPREVSNKVEKATGDKMEEFSEALINVLQVEARKRIPLLANEKLPEIAERAVQKSCNDRIPEIVQREARGAVGTELKNSIKPLIDSDIGKFKSKAIGAISAIVLVAIILLGFNVFFLFQLSRMEPVPVQVEEEGEPLPRFMQRPASE